MSSVRWVIFAGKTLRSLGQADKWSPPQVVNLQLVLVTPLRLFIVIAQGWPSCLISILDLQLPLVGALYPPLFHRHFNSPTNTMFTSWKSALALNAVTLDGDFTVVVSGSHSSVQRIRGGLHNPGCNIYDFEMDLAAKKCRKNLCKSQGVMRILGWLRWCLRTSNIGVGLILSCYLALVEIPWLINYDGTRT